MSAYNCRLKCDRFILWLADVIIVILVIYFQTVWAAYQGFFYREETINWGGSSLEAQRWILIQTQSGNEC